MAEGKSKCARPIQYGNRREAEKQWKRGEEGKGKMPETRILRRFLEERPQATPGNGDEWHRVRPKHDEEHCK